jgi:hypothetical protein
MIVTVMAITANNDAELVKGCLDGLETNGVAVEGTPSV